jgi:hypothetical protein
MTERVPGLDLSGDNDSRNESLLEAEVIDQGDMNEAAKIKLDYKREDGWVWVRTIRLSDMKFQWAHKERDLNAKVRRACLSFVSLLITTSLLVLTQIPSSF